MENTANRRKIVFWVFFGSSAIDMAPGERQERVRMESGGSQEGVRRIESGGSQEGVRRESGSMSHGAWGQALDRMFLRAQYANPGGVSLASPLPHTL